MNVDSILIWNTLLLLWLLSDNSIIWLVGHLLRKFCKETD